MQYKIFHDKSSVLSVEEVLAPDKEIVIGFEGAAPGSYVCISYIGDKGEVKRYRKIEDGKISFPTPETSTTLHITYVEDEGMTYECTQIDVVVTDSAILLHPNLSHIYDEIKALHIKAEEQANRLAELEKAFQGLKEKFAEMYEGYNVI